PRSPLACAERGNPVGVRSHQGWVGRSQEGHKPSAGQDAQEADAGRPKGNGTRRQHPAPPGGGCGEPAGCRFIDRPERVLTWAGEPLTTEAESLANRGTSWTPTRCGPPRVFR